MEPISTRQFPGLKVVAQVRAAEPEQSGDGYEVVSRQDGTTAIWMVDAVGHGREACSEREEITRLLRQKPEWTALPAEQALNEADQMLSAQGKDIAMAFIEVDCQSQTLTVATSGIPQPMILRGDSGRLETVQSTGINVGYGYSELPHDVVKTPFHPGDRLVLFSDGITDARDSQNALFNPTGVGQVLQGGGESETLLDRIMHAALGHAGRQLPEDDSTVIVVESQQRRS